MSIEAGLLRLRSDFPLFGGQCLKIVDKVGRSTPLLLNRAQLYVHAALERQRAETGRARALILKGRQQGISTYVGGRFYWRTALDFGKRAFIIAHEQKATDNLFSMVKRYHEHNPLAPSTGRTNAKELIFDRLDGGYKLATAGSKDVGRSNTAQLLHASEFAFWDNAELHLAGIGNTVADLPDTEILIESTANGQGNAFHRLWQEAEAGRGEWLAIFVPWFWQPEYRAALPREGIELDADELKYQRAYGLDMEQMLWRRRKIGTYGAGFGWLFDQEYPAMPGLAFRSATADPLIPPTLVGAAVNSGFLDRAGPLLIGCDPAEFGPDRTAIVFRRGRVVPRIEKYEKKGPMEVAGILADHWREHRPDAIFVDKIGIGSGIVDRLRELNIPVIGVNSAMTPADTELFRNKRAEMWWRMKAWLEDTPNRLPNDGELIADLSAPSFKFDSNGKRLVESKDDMRARGVRSPDVADALALTFAEPVAARDAVLTVARSPDAKPATSAGY